MHDSRDTQVYLSCSSHPIIENSSEIGFAAYPTVIGNRLGIVEENGEDWLDNELVEDFNWLRREHSPNWRIIDEKIDQDTWGTVLQLTEGDSLSPKSILALVME